MAMVIGYVCSHRLWPWLLVVAFLLSLLPLAMAIAYCMWLLPMAIDYWLLLLAMAIACGYGYWLQPMDIYTMGYYGKLYWLWSLPVVIGY